jgi:hypothetical protein
MTQQKKDLRNNYVTGFLETRPALEAVEAARKRLEIKVMEFQERFSGFEVSPFNGNVFRAPRNVLPLFKEQNIRGFERLYL